jgi:hypothetical protein
MKDKYSLSICRNYKSDKYTIIRREATSVGVSFNPTICRVLCK